MVERAAHGGWLVALEGGVIRSPSLRRQDRHWKRRRAWNWREASGRGRIFPQHQGNRGVGVTDPYGPCGFIDLEHFEWSKALAFGGNTGLSFRMLAGNGGHLNVQQSELAPGQGSDSGQPDARQRRRGDLSRRRGCFEPEDVCLSDSLIPIICLVGHARLHPGTERQGQSETGQPLPTRFHVPEKHQPRELVACAEKATWLWQPGRP